MLLTTNPIFQKTSFYNFFPPQISTLKFACGSIYNRCLFVAKLSSPGEGLCSLRPCRQSVL